MLSTTDKTQLQLKALLYAELRYLRTIAKWPQAKKTHTFTLEANRAFYPLPADFYTALADTQWDQANRWRLDGPMSDGQFSDRLYGLGSSGIDKAFRIRSIDSNIYTAGGQFQIDPTPTENGGNLSFDYFTANLFVPPFWRPSETGITVNTWRFANNLYLKCTAITTGTTGTTAPTAAGVDGGVTWAVLSTGTGTVTGTYETIVSNNDLVLYDEDVVTTGFKWRWLKAKGRDYAVEASEYKKLLNTAITRYNGSYRGSMGNRGRTGPSYQTQWGSWTF